MPGRSGNSGHHPRCCRRERTPASRGDNGAGRHVVATHFDTVDVDHSTIVDAHVDARRRWRRRRIELSAEPGGDVLVRRRSPEGDPRAFVAVAVAEFTDPALPCRVVEPRGTPGTAGVDSGIEVAPRLEAPHAGREVGGRRPGEDRETFDPDAGNRREVPSDHEGGLVAVDSPGTHEAVETGSERDVFHPRVAVVQRDT